MLIGPSGDQGGMNWGTAFDGERIHVSITNHHHIPYKLTQNGMLTDETSTGGSCAALDPKTGKILWHAADWIRSAAVERPGRLFATAAHRAARREGRDPGSSRLRTGTSGAERLQ